MRNRFFLLLLCLVSTSVFAQRELEGREGLIPPFASEVIGLDMPNAHWLVPPSKDHPGLLRAMRPQLPRDFDQIKNLGIRRVLVFKEFREGSTSGTLDQEEDGFAKVGILSEDIKHIPFKYHGFRSYQHACEQSLEALRILEQAESDAIPVYFHCTMGEDRTGYLAGLYRFRNGAKDIDAVFKSELCEYGYEAGDPYKPEDVSARIRSELSPLFFYLADRLTKLDRSQPLSDELCHDADHHIKEIKNVPACTASTRVSFPRRVYKREIDSIDL